jgi:signal transduction histidine kinase/PAS domain-containing protein
VPVRRRRPQTGYLLALLVATVATSVTFLLDALVPAFGQEEVVLLVGIVLVALTCGAGPSLLATGVGLLAGVLLSSMWQHPADWVDLTVLLVSGLGFSLLAGQSRWARRKAEALAGSLRAAKAASDMERQRLRTLLDVLPVPVAMVDTQGRFLELTPANRTIWGEPASWARELAEVPAYPARRPDTGQPVARDELPIVRALTTGETTLDKELEFEAVDGQRKILLNSAAPIRDATGAIVGAVGQAQDITEHKRLEAALRQAEREAAERARELEAIFEALTDGVLVYDAEGRILRTNTAARQLLGFEVHPKFAALPWKERASCYAPRDGQRRPIPPEDLALARLLRGEVLTGAHTAEDTLHTPDGREVWFSMTGRPLRDAAGTIIGAVGVARDETERRQLERQVAENAAQLDAIFESIADGITVTDPQGRVLRMNQAGRTSLGLELDPTGWTLPQLEEVAGFAGYTPAGRRLIEGEDPVPRILKGKVLTKQQSVDTVLRTRTGREILLNSAGAPIRDAAGHILGAVLVARDVTEQRRLEREVAEHAAQLHAIFESIADGVLVTDPQGRVLRMNQAGRTLLGLGPEQDPTGWTLRELEGPVGFASYTPAGRRLGDGDDPLPRVLQGEILAEHESLDVIVRTRTGRETRINTTGAPIRDAAGQLLGGVFVSRDVTGQRRLEQQTRTALNALLAMAEALVQGREQAEGPEPEVQARNQAFQPGADPTPAGVAARLAELTRRVLDCRSVSIIALDPATEALAPIAVVGHSPEDEQRWWTRWEQAGQEREEGQQRHLQLGDVLPPSALAALHAGELVLPEQLPASFLQWLQQHSQVRSSVLVPMRIGEALVGVLQIEGRECRPVGETSATEQKGALVQAVARLGALVLERERLLRERTQAQATELALRQTQAQMEAFVATAAHDLRSPLAAAVGFLELAQRQTERLAAAVREEYPLLTPRVEGVRARLDDAAEGTQRLTRLLNVLFDTAALRTGKLELHRAPCDLVALLRGQVAALRVAGPERAIRLHLPAAASEEPIVVEADADRIGQVVTNYVTNALKYSSPDQPIDVSVEEHGSRVHVARVVVRDQGPGIPKAEQARVWEPFHRAPGVTVQGGTQGQNGSLGLGLHICKAIVEAHGGRVGVESTVGEGSTFWFTLPLSDAPLVPPIAS